MTPLSCYFLSSLVATEKSHVIRICKAFYVTVFFFLTLDTFRIFLFILLCSKILWCYIPWSGSLFIHFSGYIYLLVLGSFLELFLWLVSSLHFLHFWNSYSLNVRLPEPGPLNLLFFYFLSSSLLLKTIYFLVLLWEISSSLYSSSSVEVFFFYFNYQTVY